MGFSINHAAGTISNTNTDMTAYVKAVSPGLQITIVGIKDEDRGRVARLEVNLLGIYTGHRSLPWLKTGSTFSAVWLTYHAKPEDIQKVIKVLTGYQIETWVWQKP
jgi:hypothetical protein